MCRSGFEFLSLISMSFEHESVPCAPPGKSMKPVVFLLSRPSSTSFTTLTFVFAALAAGFRTPTVRLRLLLRGGARILAGRRVLAADAGMLRRWSPGDGGMVVRGRGAPGVRGGAINCCCLSSEGGGVDARLNLFVSTSCIHQACSSKQVVGLTPL